jgi:hypothetical protein
MAGLGTTDSNPQEYGNSRQECVIGSINMPTRETKIKWFIYARVTI